MRNVTVKYTNPQAGWDCDIKQREGCLELGKEYPINGIVVHDWHTDVFIDGIDEGFNDTAFTYCIDGKEVNRGEALEEFGFERI